MCISSENSSNYLECQLILTGLPSLWLDHISSDWSGVDWSLASPFTNSFCRFLCPNPTRFPLPTSGYVEDRGLRPLFGFAPKQTKGSSAWWTTYIGCPPRGVMVKAMNYGIVVREFVLQSRYYVHFRANALGKGMNPLILPLAMGK